ncbi:MAG: PH domain-containing protein, partial [Micromonosporaceae bacterium]
LLPVADVPTARQVITEVLPGFDLTSVTVLPVPRRARLLAPLRAGVLGYNLMPNAFVARDGLLTRHLTVVPYARIQSIRVVQGPWQRLLRLATVHVDTAGHTAGGLAPYRGIREVRALVVELSARARSARLALRPSSEDS